VDKKNVPTDEQVEQNGNTNSHRGTGLEHCQENSHDPNHGSITVTHQENQDKSANENIFLPNSKEEILAIAEDKVKHMVDVLKKISSSHSYFNSYQHNFISRESILDNWFSTYPREYKDWITQFS